jgi:hypothetical protein
VATGLNDVDEIFQRMAVIRRELHTNVRESVAGAEAFADWGRFTWTYPWIALGAAAAVGYVVYTSGHQTAREDISSLADGSKAGECVVGARAKGQGISGIGPKILLAAWDIVFPVAVRAGQNYLLHMLEQQYPTRTVGPASPSPSARERGGWIGRAGR